MPSPRLARSATAPGALACSAMSGWMPWAAQAWSSTVRIPVPAGRHTIGYAVMSARVTRACPARGWPGGRAATSRSLMMGSALSPGGGAPDAPMRARSASPARTRSVSRSELSSIRVISTPGWARWKAARALNSGVTVHAVTMPTTSRPRISPFTASTACRTAPADASTARACGSAAAPAAVRVAARPDRSIRVAPRSCSSCRIWALTPDWLICTRCAARVKFASSATAMKYSSCLISIATDSSCHKNHLLDFLLRSNQDGQCSNSLKEGFLCRTTTKP
jgi:hypothetical protein